MINIQIDVESIIDQVYMSPEQVNDLSDFAVKEITAQFAMEWERVASENLKSARQEYIANINVVDEGFLQGAVVLTGWLPNALESGVSAFDIKHGLLNGPNAKVAQDGSKYNTVPFKHGTPGAKGENFNGGVMPKEIHKIVKKQKVDKKTGKSAGLVKSQLPTPFKKPQVKTLPNGGSYTHKNAIYEGLRKSVDSVGNISYESFRRVSDKSDVNSWQHPGLESKDLADEALKEFDLQGTLSAAIDQWWEANM